MPKVYEPQPESKELFLRLTPVLTRGGSLVALDLCRSAGDSAVTLATVSETGIALRDSIPSHHATRAGFSPEALDSNGRLKVIGQESVEAERMARVQFQCAMSCHDGLIAEWAADGTLDITVVNGGLDFGMNLSPADTRDLAARLNRHVAFLDKEGL